jgi:hypothetical protein
MRERNPKHYYKYPYLGIDAVWNDIILDDRFQDGDINNRDDDTYQQRHNNSLDYIGYANQELKKDFINRKKELAKNNKIFKKISNSIYSKNK